MTSDLDTAGGQGAARLAALRATGLLDSAAEPAFDRLTRLAARVLRVPVTLVSLVDQDRQYFKSCFGLPEPVMSARQTPLSHSFCKYVVASDEPLVVRDARENPLVSDNGAVRDLGVLAYAGVPLRTPDGHVLGSFCAIDVVPRDWTEEELGLLHDLAGAATSEIGLRLARDAAESASRAKDRFLAALSHELRTPVSPVLMLATAMADDESMPLRVREDAATIRRNIDLQTRLIDDLLDVTRIENGKLTMRAEPVDLHEVLVDSVRLCRDDADAKGIALSHKASGAGACVSGDPARLRQVFCNLVKNAVKFTPAGGRVTVAADGPASGRVAVTVSDTGIGVEPALLARIFNPFEQGDRAITNEASGLGLGLAIARGIVQAHGGAVAAASEGRGRGTTIRVELPAEIPATKSCAGGNGSPAAAGPVVPASAPVKPSILLVDDHHDTLMALSRLLRVMGYRVVTADSKVAALTAAAGQRFDLVISDIGLPDGSGLELMRELRGSGSDVKGIALTGYGTQTDVNQTLEAGFAAHLTKPIDISRVEAAIKGLVR